jgi:hypothetical protein
MWGVPRLATGRLAASVPQAGCVVGLRIPIGRRGLAAVTAVLGELSLEIRDATILLLNVT